MFLRQSFLFPSLAHGGQELVLVCSHLPDERLVAGFFMSGRPQNHFRQHWRKINALGRQRVNHFSAVGGISLCLDNSVGFQAAETVSQNICRNFFAGVQKLVKRLVSTQHHVAQDQERPPIAQRFHRCVEWTSERRFGAAFFFCMDLA